MDTIVADYKAGKVTVADLRELDYVYDGLREAIPLIVAYDAEIGKDINELLRLAYELDIINEACLATVCSGAYRSICQAVEVYSDHNTDVPGGYSWRYFNTCIVMIAYALKNNCSDERMGNLLDVVRSYFRNGLVAYHLSTHNTVDYRIVRLLEFNYENEMAMTSSFEDEHGKRGRDRLMYFKHGDV